jgi:hypothetical protein
MAQAVSKKAPGKEFGPVPIVLYGTGIKIPSFINVKFAIENGRKTCVIHLGYEDDREVKILSFRLNTDTRDSVFDWNILADPAQLPEEKSKALFASKRILSAILLELGEDPTQIKEPQSQAATAGRETSRAWVRLSRAVERVVPDHELQAVQQAINNARQGAAEIRSLDKGLNYVYVGGKKLVFDTSGSTIAYGTNSEVLRQIGSRK